MSSCNDGFCIPWGRGGRIAPAWQQYTTLPSQSLTWMAEGKREDDLSWVSDWWISSYCSFFDTWWLEGKEGGLLKLCEGVSKEKSRSRLSKSEAEKKCDILPILCNKILAMSNFVSWVWNPNAEPIMTRNLEREREREKERERERSLHSATPQPPCKPSFPRCCPQGGFFPEPDREREGRRKMVCGGGKKEEGEERSNTGLFFGRGGVGGREFSG